MERMLFIVIFGAVDGVVAKKVGIPGGAVVGSMLGAGLTAIVLPGRFVLPDAAATAIQVMLGVSLGMTFDRSFLTLCGQVLPMAILSTVVLLSVAVLMAYTAQRLGLIDFATALFGFSPGGMSGMSLLAQTEGYNTAVVAFLRVVRIFTLFLLVPVLGRFFLVWAKGS